MKRSLLVLAAIAATSLLSGSAMADSYFDNAYYSVNVGNTDYINTWGMNRLVDAGKEIGVAQVDSDGVGKDVGIDVAPGSYYADAGIVLGYDGSLTLGQLQGLNVTIANSGYTAPLSVNLWLDTNTSNDAANNSYFFNVGSTGITTTGAVLTAAGTGDSYLGTNIGTIPLGGTGTVSGSSSFYGLGGDGAGGNYTLAQLQAGDVPGINDSTRVAIWIGMAGNGGATGIDEGTEITNVTVAPLPASDWSGLALLSGLGIYSGIKRFRGRMA